MTATLRKYSSIDNSGVSAHREVDGSMDGDSNAFLTSSLSAGVTPKPKGVMERRYSVSGTDVEQNPRRPFPCETETEAELSSTNIPTQRSHFHRSSIANFLNRIPDPHTFSRNSILNHYASRQDGSIRHLQMEANVKMYQNSKSLDRYLFLYDDVLVIMKKKTQKSYHWKGHYETALLWMTSNFADPSVIPLLTTSVESTSSEKCLYLGWPMETWLVEYETKSLREEFEKYLSRNIHEIQIFLSRIEIPIRWKNWQIDQDVVDFCSAETSIGDLKRKWLKGTLDDDLIIRIRVSDELRADLLGPENIFAVLFFYCCSSHEGNFSLRRNSIQGHIMTLQAFKDRFLSLIDKDSSYNKSITSLSNPPSVAFEAHKRRPDSRELFISDNSLNADTVSDYSDHRYSSFLSSKSTTKSSPRLKRAKQTKSRSKKSLSAIKIGQTSLIGAKSEGDIHVRLLKDIWPNGAIPKTFRILCSMVYRLRIDNISTGVFRRSGNKEQETSLVRTLDQNESFFSICLEDISPITIACAIKTFLRNLPEGLLENRLQSVDAILDEENNQAKMSHVISWLINLTDVNRRLACFVLTLLWNIHLSENVHRMGAEALSKILGPSLGFSVDLMQDQKILDDVCATVKYLILHAPFIVNGVANYYGDPINDPDMESILNQLETLSESTDYQLYQRFNERASSEPVTSSTRCVSLIEIPGQCSNYSDYHNGGNSTVSHSNTRNSHENERIHATEQFLKPPSPSKAQVYQPQIKSINRPPLSNVNTEKSSQNVSICHGKTSPVLSPKTLSPAPQPPPRTKRGQSLSKSLSINNFVPTSPTDTPKIMADKNSICHCAQSAPPNSQIEKTNSYQSFPVESLSSVTTEPILRKSFNDSGLHSMKSSHRPVSENMDPCLSAAWRSPSQFSADISIRNVTSSDTDSIFFDNLSSASFSSRSVSSKECSHKKIRTNLAHGSAYALLPTKMNQFSPTPTNHHSIENSNPKLLSSLNTEMRRPRERIWTDRIDKKPDSLSMTSSPNCSMCSSSNPTPNNFSSDIDSEGTDSAQSFSGHSTFSSNPFSNSSVLYRRGIRTKSSNVNRRSLTTVKEQTISAKDFSEHMGSVDVVTNSRRPLPIASRRPQSFTALDKYSQQRRPPQVPPRSQTKSRRKSTDVLHRMSPSHFLKEEIKTAQHNFV